MSVNLVSRFSPRVQSVVRPKRRIAAGQDARSIDGSWLKRAAGQSGNIVSRGREADRLAYMAAPSRGGDGESRGETETPEWDSIRVYVFSLGSEMDLIWTLTGRRVALARAAHARVEREGGSKTLKQHNQLSDYRENRIIQTRRVDQRRQALPDILWTELPNKR